MKGVVAVAVAVAEHILWLLRIENEEKVRLMVAEY
jgi:hypothetical protein